MTTTNSKLQVKMNNSGYIRVTRYKSIGGEDEVIYLNMHEILYITKVEDRVKIILKRGIAFSIKESAIYLAECMESTYGR